MQTAAFAAQILLTAGSIVPVVRQASRYAKEGQLGQLIGELGTPVFLWLMFGIGGTFAMARTSESRMIYQVAISNSDILTATFIAILGASAYVAAFRFVWNRMQSKSETESSTWNASTIIWPLIWTILAIDLLIRVVLVRSGFYFAWTAGRNTLTADPGPVIHLFNAFWPFLIASLGYALVTGIRSRRAAALLVLVMILDLAIGQRRRFLLLVIILLLVAFAFSQPSLRPKALAKGLAIAVLLIVVAFPAIEASRQALRRDVASIPVAQIPLLFVSEYVPQAVNALNPIGGSGSASSLGNSVPGLVDRVSNWSVYTASIVHRWGEGYPPQGISTVLVATSSIIPGGDEVVDANAAVYAHFNMGYPSLDAAGSMVADSFSQLGFFGVVTAFVSAGAIVGGVFGLLARRGDLGMLAMISFVPALIPVGDSFISFFSAIRNTSAAAVVLIAVLVLAREAGIPAHASKRSSTSAPLSK